MVTPSGIWTVVRLMQYLKEKTPANTDLMNGYNLRAVAQSLLMSTAAPMHIGSKTGPYYPTIQVGAGLANVHNAVHASSVIFMGSDATASYADGKVKAECPSPPRTLTGP